MGQKALTISDILLQLSLAVNKIVLKAGLRFHYNLLAKMSYKLPALANVFCN